MERQEIEVFLALCEELHFSRTAARLRLSPARVTQLVQKTERHIGAPLFERTSRGVTLTEIGELLRRNLAPAHEAVQEAVRVAKEAGRGTSGLLRLGFIGPTSGQLLTSLAESFAQAHPGADCRVLLQAEIADQLRPLHEQRVDVLAVQLPVLEPGLVVGPVITRDRMLMVVGKGHPLVAKGVASYEDFADHTVVTTSAKDDFVDHYLPRQTPSGRPIERRLRVDTIDAGFALVAAGKGIGPIVTDFARYRRSDDLVYLPLEDAPVCEVALVWSAARESELVRAFARHVAAHPVTDIFWEPERA
ncbi:LysR family transcriptional regulator [Glycomyces sp. NPDC048151]|uniref:LysR family transcriptional regulator n=1 Tax=Glycomyces sp. NPDC048151 TaxID=3364002 RepID=UPI0037201770